MATDYKPVWASGKEPRLVAGAFACNGSSSPTVSSGVGYTVARTGTGTLEVTVNEGRGRIIAALPMAQFGTANVAVAELSAVNYPSSSFTVTTTSGGSAFDFGDDLVVHFQCSLENLK